MLTFLSIVRIFSIVAWILIVLINALPYYKLFKKISSCPDGNVGTLYLVKKMMITKGKYFLYPYCFLSIPRRLQNLTRGLGSRVQCALRVSTRIRKDGRKQEGNSRKGEKMEGMADGGKQKISQKSKTKSLTYALSAFYYDVLKKL